MSVFLTASLLTASLLARSLLARSDQVLAPHASGLFTRSVLGVDSGELVA